VEQGAKYEPHWSYIRVVRVDRFIRARLTHENIALAPDFKVPM
jgi:hypothetical protein